MRDGPVDITRSAPNSQLATTPNNRQLRTARISAISSSVGRRAAPAPTAAAAAVVVAGGVSTAMPSPGAGAGAAAGAAAAAVLLFPPSEPDWPSALSRAARTSSGVMDDMMMVVVGLPCDGWGVVVG